jgi:hypothetical protein
MKRIILLREYLRTCRRVKMKPSPDGFKKVEYLRFIGANACPACAEEVMPQSYICVRDKEGGIVEKYRCPSCGTDYVFPRDVVH